MSAMDMNGWRPIDSAPQDDTRILVCRPKADEYSQRVGVDRWRSPHGSGAPRWIMSSTANQPTHWQPLPAPPTASP